MGVAIAQAAERNDPASHRITADGVVHMQELLEEPQSDEGFILHVVERADGL